MHTFTLVWELFWVLLFTAVVYWPRKPLFYDAKHWNPTAYDLNRLSKHADKARTERKDLEIPDKFIRII